MEWHILTAPDTTWLLFLDNRSYQGVVKRHPMSLFSPSGHSVHCKICFSSCSVQPFLGRYTAQQLLTRYRKVRLTKYHFYINDTTPHPGPVTSDSTPEAKVPRTASTLLLQILCYPVRAYTTANSTRRRELLPATSTPWCTTATLHSSGPLSSGPLPIAATM